MKYTNHWLISVIVIITMFGFHSCEKFFDPEHDLIVKEDDFFLDWYDYRAAEMGLYGLQQELVEQLVILGELRGDLLEVTENASRELLEIYNFEISETNKYASPRNFYKLIAACNNLQRTLEYYHPEVLDPETTVTNYDRLYGEVIVMRAWAYFNAVRIYGKIPYVPVSITSIKEITEFVNSPRTVKDSMDIIFHPDGRNNDTIYYEQPKQLENSWLELGDIVDSCTHQITTKIKAVGVNHYLNNDDATWEVTVWSEYAMYFLLGQMYLHQGDLYEANRNFNKLLYYTDPESNNIRFGLDKTFQKTNWKNILTSINRNEHLFVVWFGKSFRQTNELQKIFSNVPPNDYQLKPTKQSILYWETIWDNTRLKYWPSLPTNPDHQDLRDGYPGIPGDFYRGHNVSYAYTRDNVPLENSLVREMLELKRDQNDFELELFMDGIDTVVYKYSIGKEGDPFASDANFIVARAAAAHLYAAEIYTYYAWNDVGGGNYQTTVTRAEQFLNDGSYRGIKEQLGVRGRVGFADDYEKVVIPDIIFLHDPFTNEVIGHINMAGNLQKKQYFLEDKILEERARELAYEGERFYDLIRIARRRGDNAYLADRVASKFQGSQAELIRSRLMDQSNWYLPFYLGIN